MVVDVDSGTRPFAQVETFREVHMSEVNTSSRHDPISFGAIRAFSIISSSIPETVPIILETLIDRGQSEIDPEMTRASEVFAAVAL